MTGRSKRGLDAVASSAASGVCVGIIPAGTANLLAGNLGIPTDLEQAVRIALDGDRRALDLGVVNHEHFAVMAGTGLDALMMKEAGAGLKDRVGRLAYLWTGIRASRARAVKMSVVVDGGDLVQGPGELPAVRQHGSPHGWVGRIPRRPIRRRPARDRRRHGGNDAAMGTRPRNASERSAGTLKLVQMGRGRKISVKLDRELPYELDGGARTSTKKLRVRVAPRGGDRLRPSRGGPALIPVYVTALVMVVAGVVSFVLFRYWPALRFGPRIDPGKVRNEVRKHPRLAAVVSARLDPSALTGLALTIAGAIVVVGAVFFGLVFIMIRAPLRVRRLRCERGPLRGPARHARLYHSPADFHPTGRRPLSSCLRQSSCG